MKKNLLYTTLWLMGIMGTLAIWVVSAETTISEPYGHIDYMLNENEPFEAQFITISDWTDTITILDRNLWAKKAWTGCEDPSWWTVCEWWDDTYGYHFQRGNNYWFDPNDSSIKTNAKSVSSSWADWDDSGSYNNSWYYGTTFIISDYSHWYDYWKDSTSSSSNHENLWWWEWDYDDANKGFWINNENRRGPCPEWFHVPSYGELQKLQSMLNAGGKRNTGTLHNELLIPFAGLRNYTDASVYGMGGNASLWSSSPFSASYPASQGLNLYIGGYLAISSFYRAYALSVRCFYDSYQPFTQSFTLSFTGSEWGSVDTWSIEAEEWSSISRDAEAGTVSISWTVVVSGISDEWYVFSWWLTDCDGDTVTTGCSFTGVFKLETYTITYELNWWTNNENNLTWYTIKDSITFENPTKEWYTFDGWFTDAQFTTWITSISTWTTWPITVYAKWTENKKSSWSSGWGGRSSRISDDSQISPDPSLSRGEEDSSLIKEGDREAVEDLDSNTPTDSSTSSQNDTKTYSTEFQQAYEFAKEKWITTMPTINDANMNGKLTRIAMAKMLSYYAINVLWQKPDETRYNKFNDITDKLDAQYDSGVTLAYQLWIMWINMPNNNFRPNDEVTRAEFATALSRMLYSTPDGKPYYSTHLAKLKAEWILKNDDYKMKELRWYVMIMLKRSPK